MNSEQKKEMKEIKEENLNLKENDTRRIAMEEQQKRYQEFLQRDKKRLDEREIVKIATRTAESIIKRPWYKKVGRFLMWAALIFLFFFPYSTGEDDVAGEKIIYAVNPFTKIAFYSRVEETVQKNEDGKLEKSYTIKERVSGFASYYSCSEYYELGGLKLGEETEKDKNDDEKNEFSFWERIKYAVLGAS